MNELNYNPILDTDSYKASHFRQYPKNTHSLYAYIESRGGLYDKTLFFGLQYILKRYLSQGITRDNIEEAAELFAAHGEPFDREGWEYILNQHGGRLPLVISAVPEGTVVPTHCPLVTVQSTDPKVAWLASYVETMLLRVWYPLTVATQSWDLKQIIRKYLEETCDRPDEELLFKLHDFGARGVSSEESAGIGGMAHLVNFRGTDTVSALRYARAYYQEPMAGFSIPASEHSTTTSYGRKGERGFFKKMIQEFSGPGKLFACVVDSYDIYNAVDQFIGQDLKEELIQSGGTMVVRPDSGNPVEMALATAKMLKARFGVTPNGKGYGVLNHVRIIYGDGVNPTSIRGILMELKAHGFSAENIAFGMGGALLQRVDRDTQRMAMKVSALETSTEQGWKDVYKDPITDKGKASKKGRVSTYQNPETGEMACYRLGEAPKGWVNLLRPVWMNGQLLVDESLGTVRERSDRA